MRLEELGPSKTVETLTDLVGRGKVSIAAATEVCQGVVQDHNLPHRAIKCFASLGCDGRHHQNAERDLHRWLNHLYGCTLHICYQGSFTSRHLQDQGNTSACVTTA